MPLPRSIISRGVALAECVAMESGMGRGGQLGLDFRIGEGDAVIAGPGDFVSRIAYVHLTDSSYCLEWEGEGPPFVKNGCLEFHNGGKLSFRRTDIRITDIAIAVRTLDRTQALDVVVGENEYLLHFLSGYIRIGGASGPVVPLKSNGGSQTLNISIPSTGDTTLAAGGARVMAPVRKSGAMYIQVEQSRPLLPAMSLSPV